MKTQTLTLLIVSLMNIQAFADKANTRLRDRFDRPAQQAAAQAVLFANKTKIQTYVEQAKRDMGQALEAVDQIARLAEQHKDSPQLQQAAADGLVDIVQHARPSAQGQNPYFKPALNAIDKLSSIYDRNPKLQEAIVKAMVATTVLDTSPEIFAKAKAFLESRFGPANGCNDNPNLVQKVLIARKEAGRGDKTSNLYEAKNHCFVVEVDYRQTVEQAVAAGHYNWADSSINSINFSDSESKKGVSAQERGKARTKIVLVHLNRYVTTQEAIQELDRLDRDQGGRGYRPANLYELLALGAQYPELQRELWIVALGSSWVDSRGHRRVPYLDGWDSGRLLNLNWDIPGSEWEAPWRFAVVRK